MSPSNALPIAADPRTEQRFSLRETGRILEMPESRLKSLARAGLLAPQRGPVGPITFGFRDILLLRTTKDLIASGVPMRRVRRIWASLQKQLNDGVPLTSISIRAEGDQVVATDGTQSWHPDSGQVVLDFDALELPAQVETARAGLRLVESPKAAEGPRVHRAPSHDRAAEDDGAELTAEQLYEDALDIEESSPEEAIETYRRVLELDPFMADAHVNLGRLYQQAGERGRAEAHYRDAVRLNTTDPVPHFNLGVLLEEQGRREEAAHAYSQAVNRDPDFADAHCNLGLLLEALGRRQEAMRHLMTARELYRAE